MTMSLLKILHCERITQLTQLLPKCGISTSSGPLNFRATTCLNSMPMKKKKKSDMNIVLQRESRRKRKLEKAVNKLVAKGRTPKPIDEFQVDKELSTTLEQRKREVPVHSFEVSEERALLLKEWTRHKWAEHFREKKIISRALRSQQKALKELKNESEELYQMAIQPNENLIPYTFKGPVYTPPIKDYDSPDGEYIDTTKKFDKMAPATIDIGKLKIKVKQQ